MIVNRGFGKKRDDFVAGDRLPPGQYLTEDFPVLSLGPTPYVEESDYRLRVYGLVEKEIELNWEELNNLPQTEIVKDIHCVTKWSKFDTNWKGVMLDEIIKLVKPDPSASHIIAYSYDGYSTNLPIEDVVDGKALVALSYSGEEIPAVHGGPVRLVVPHLYFWKSAKWLQAIEFVEGDRPGFWEERGYHNYGDPWKEQRYDTDE